MTADHEVYETTRTRKRVDRARKVLQLPGGWDVPEPQDLHPSFYAWAGLVVSEGSISCRKITMASGEPIDRATGMLPGSARVRRKNFSNGHVPDWFLYWNEFWDRIEPALAHEKSIPEWVFQSSNHRAALFLNFLYAGDGWASGHRIGYASTSRVLAEQVSALLWRLNIRSTVARRPARGAWREQWHVQIVAAESVLRFTETVGITGKDRALAQVSEEARRRVASKSHRGDHRRAEEDTERLRAVRGYNIRNRERYAGIRSVEPCGESRVFDLTIEEHHRFTVGTSIVSNCDEEPPQDVYGEALRRLAVLQGIMMLTMTPLLGMTEVVGYFHPEPNMQRRALVMMDITEAGHYTPEEAEEEIQAMKPHERAARARGEPMLGSGRIFPVADEAVVVDWFSVPQSWPRVIGLDIGYDHPTAAVLMAIDRENDRMYIIDEYSQTEEIITVHAAALKPWGEYPIAWPHDGYEHSKDSGLAIADLYRNEGLKMWHEHATFPPVPGKKTGGYGLQAGLDEMLDRMRTNRFKVFSNCTKWLQEFRTYHRKDGKVVKLRDDLISASRIAMMMRRIARTHDVYRRPPPPMLSDWNPSEA